MVYAVMVRHLPQHLQLRRILLNDFGKLGTAYVETDEAQADESTGTYSNPVRVVAFNTHEGWSRDVTEATAQMILRP